MCVPRGGALSGSAQQPAQDRAGPVIIIVVGAGTEAIIFMALAISLIVTVLEMLLAGFRATNPESIKMARTFGATKRRYSQDRISVQYQHIV